jgi:hypothetical protein
VCDSAVEGEGAGEGGALLFAEGSKVRVGDELVFCSEVVVTLCVLDRMESVSCPRYIGRVG